MLQALIGKKIDQSQTFLENGRRISVTEVSVADNIVVQVKTAEKDKYTAVQLGIGAKKKPFKSLIGHSKKAGLENVPALIREVAWFGEEELPKSGDVVTVEAVFKAGDIVKVTGTSKGKGFAGGVKRHNFRGGPKTHGQSDRHRAPGSIGQGTTPGRVYKGKKMAGHMGVDTVTISNLVIVDVDPENKKMYVLGLVPGNKKSPLIITKTGEQKKFVRLLSVKLKEDEEAKIEAEKLAKEQEKAAAEAAKAEAEKPAEPVKTEEIKEEPVNAENAQTETQTAISEEQVPTTAETVSDAPDSVTEEAEVKQDEHVEASEQITESKSEKETKKEEEK
jgi:large subunit ribosomal protein L3